MAWSSLLLGLTVLGLMINVALGNTPPTISMTRDWTVQQDEPVGAVVTRISSHDADGDPITFSINKASIGEDASAFFTIDQAGVVRLAKSLGTLAPKAYYVSVTATDGQFPSRTDARVVVGGSHPGKSTSRGGLVAALNPSPFNLPRGIPAFTNPSRRQPPIFGGDGGFGPPAIPPTNNQQVGGSPPLLTLPTPPTWSVASSAARGALVTTVKAMNLTGDAFFFSLKDELGLVAIDPQTGAVTVQQDLGDKVGNHRVLVEVTNRFGTADGEVLLQVLPDVVHTTSPAGEEVEEEEKEREELVEHTRTHVSTSTQGTDTRPTLIAIIKNGPTPPPSTTVHPMGEPLTPEDVVPSSGPSVVVVVLIVGVTAGSFVCGPLLWFCCCRRSRRERRGGKKESRKSLDKKGLELTPVSSTSSSLSRQESQQAALPQALPQLLRFWERRASENKYEEGGGTPPAVPARSMSIQDATMGSTSDSADSYEFPRHRLKVLSILGEGCFGQVWKYEAQDLHGPGTGKCYVAVKTLKESAGPQERRDLQQELKVLKSLGDHPNVVSLLACCTEKEPTLVVLEYLENGKLQTYLRERRSKQPYNNLHGSSSSLSPRDLTIFALQVAKGMDYLSSHGIVHRDLAARNVLVGADKVCKVADFGFARDLANKQVYERKSDGRLPIRWMAVESLFDNIFTSKTDVWSFGILLWEIVTLGSTPYPGMSAEEVMKKTQAGYRLEKPSYCKREVYNIMYYCWYEDPRERPSFKELMKLLEGLIVSEVDYIEINNFPDRCYYNVSVSAASGELL